MEASGSAARHARVQSPGWQCVVSASAGSTRKASVRSRPRYDKRSKRPKNLRQIRISFTTPVPENPADVAGLWIDYQAWLARYDARKRKIAQALAVGGRTGEVAGIEFGVTAGRIAQMRREFERDWNLQGNN